MPSPFAGMDPYIETPKLWSDFHSDLAGEIRAMLNPHLQPRYAALLTPRVTYEVVEITVTKARGIRPDVGIYRQSPPQRRVQEVVAADLDTAPSFTTSSEIVIPPAPASSYLPLEIPLRLLTVEIRLIETEELITAIEILSPVNKRPGHDGLDEYLRKRTEYLRSPVHLMEIDLLRGGTRPPLETPVPPAPYYVTLSRTYDRPHVEVWPIQFFDPLPLLPVPLLETDPDVPLDLGKAVTAVYERGGYAGWIDYQQPPPPPALSDKELSKMEGLLKSHKLPETP